MKLVILNKKEKRLLEVIIDAINNKNILIKEKIENNKATKKEKLALGYTEEIIKGLSKKI